MFIVWFIIILVALILVHELGHFCAAKWFGIRVDEFGIGFPPRLFSAKWGETLYSFNAIPFGGFVKIFGENPDDESLHGEEKERSFVHKPKWVQAIVLVAGVTFNVIAAWVLLSIVFMIGMPLSPDRLPIDVALENPQLVVVEVLADSPAQSAGLRVGDVLRAVSTDDAVLENLTPASVTGFIQEYEDTRIAFTYIREGSEYRVEVVPEEGVTEEKKAVGIGTNTIGTFRTDPFRALLFGAAMTADLIVAVTIGLGMFIVDIFSGNADFQAVAGPVGIVGLVGDASALGIVYVLNFIAVISIHLAVINLFPFPALDGGRLLFVLIEKIKGSPLNPKISNMFNAIGFVLLMILMVVITYNDIAKLL